MQDEADPGGAREAGGEVALVSLPFYSAFSSCYQIEYLAGLLAQRGIAAACHHVYYDVGRALFERGHGRLYKTLTSARYFGDYLFLARMEPARARAILDEMLAQVPEAAGLDARELRDVFEVLNASVEASLARLQAAPPALLGLSATHYQLVPSLYYAQRAKAMMPEVPIVLGGYLSGEATAADIVARHPEIDWVVFGEGEETLPALAASVLAGEPPARGVRRGGRSRTLPALPAYDGFIADGPRPDGLADKVAFSFELSRGCYWDKCDFCNFNVAYGRFRRFDFDAIVAEMDRLHARFGVRRFTFLDTSLPPSFAKYLRQHDLRRRDFDIFAEIMVDFDAEELRALRDFGVRRVQVGIETFDGAHLRAMNKHATVLQNLYNLRVCAELGITPVYGLLLNRPGDTPAHYAGMLDVMGRIAHLPPPKYLSDFDLRHGSPLYRDRGRFGAEIVFTSAAHEAVLPAAPHNCELRPSTVHWHDAGLEALAPWVDRIRARYERWSAGWDAACLALRRDGGAWYVEDRRDGAGVRHALEPAGLAVLQAARAPARAAEVAARTGLPAAAVSAHLDGLCDAALVEREGDRYLSLVTGLGAVADAAADGRGDTRPDVRASA